MGVSQDDHLFLYGVIPGIEIRCSLIRNDATG